MCNVFIRHDFDKIKRVQCFCFRLAQNFVNERIDFGDNLLKKPPYFLLRQLELSQSEETKLATKLSKQRAQ